MAQARGHVRRPANTTVFTLGAVCLIGAVVGGGVKAAGTELPVVGSVMRQGLLGAVGLGLMIWSYFLPPAEGPKPGAAGVAPAPALHPELLESWRAVLMVAVAERRFRGEGSQLDQMLRHGTAIDLRTADGVGAVHRDEGGSRLQVGGRRLAWSQIGESWERAGGRLVVMGEPGHGKTVAAITLAKRINACAGPGAPVAELFPLSEWYRWYAGHPGERLSAWLAHHLTLTYPELPAIVAQGLVDADLVLPLLDGLDEVPASYRLACRSTIDAYAGRSAPPRPFVLTCRAAEYAELAPDWVGADRVVALTGLEPAQVTATLEEETSGRPAWDLVRRLVAGGDPGLLRVFRSPLRLAIALQAYRDGDPTELVGLDPVAAQSRLWELLLRLEQPSFAGAGPEQIRGWLSFLATGMVTNGRQRFWLHELYLYVPSCRGETRRLATVIRIVVGSAAVLEMRVVLSDAGLLAALAAGLIAALLAKSNAEDPSIPHVASLRERFRAARSGVRKSLVVGLIVGLGVGLASGLQEALSRPPGVESLVSVLKIGAVLALYGAPLGGLIGGVYNMVRAGFSPLVGEPPPRLARLGPTGVLAASRKNGLVAWLVVTLAGPLIGGLAGMLLGMAYGMLSYGLIIGAAIGLAITLIPGLIVGLGNGLGFWLCHYWLRHRSSRRGFLPARLHAFLDWCAIPPRHWLRVTDAYEFRHRDLLDHLAADRIQSLAALDNAAG